MSFSSGFTQAINIKLLGSSNLKSSMGGAVGEINKLKSSLTELRSAGLKLMGVGVGISTAFIGPVVQASKFNTQLVRTGKLAGVGAAEMKVLGDVALELGAKTLFTAQQVAMGQEELVRLGFGMDVVGNKAGAFGEVLNFASAHQIEMSESAQMLIGTLRSFNQPLSDSRKVSDMFSTVLSKTGFSLDGLTEALKMANTSVPAFNQSIETQLTLLGVLANRQQGSSIGARRLSAAMTQIYTQQDKINKLFGKDTFKVYDQATGKQKNFIDVVFDMRKAMRGFSEEQQAVILKDLVGTIGLKALVPLLKAPVEEFRNLNKAISEGAISTSGFAEAVRGTPKGLWLLMKSAISGVTMEIGQHLMPIAMATMRIITSLSDRFLGFLKAHPILSKLVLISSALLGVVTLLGGGFLLTTAMLGLMMTSSAALSTSMISLAAGLTGASATSLTLSGALGILAGTIWSILWPLGAVALGAILLYKAWQHNFLGLKDTVDATWTSLKPFFVWLKTVFQQTAGFIKASFGKLIQAMSQWYTSWNAGFAGMKSPLMAFAGMVAYAIGFIVGILTKVYSVISPALAPLFDYLKMGFRGAFQVITGVLSVFLSLFTGIFKIIVSILKGDFSGALLSAKAMVKGVISGMISVFKGLWMFLQGMLGALVSGFKVTFLGLWTIVQTSMSAIWSVVKNVLSFIGDGVSWIADGILAVSQAITQALIDPFQKAWKFIGTVFNTLGDMLSQAFMGIEGVVTSLWSRVKAVFLSGFNWISGKINGMIKAVNTVSGIVGIAAMPEIPQFASGITQVPNDMLAVIHKGEAVIPRDQNPYLSSNIIKNTFNNSSASQATHIDRSIHVSGITIEVSGGEPQDFKSKLMEVFEELAKKSEVLEMGLP